MLLFSSVQILATQAFVLNAVKIPSCFVAVLQSVSSEYFISKKYDALQEKEALQILTCLNFEVEKSVICPNPITDNST